MFTPITKNGYSLDEVASAIQKAIRRGDEKNALFFSLEFFPMFSKYLWKRLQVVAVEDVENPEACSVVSSMRNAFMWNNDESKKASEYKNRIFITKAVLYLCREVKSREADHAQAYVDQIAEEKLLPIPDYSFDVHTKKGRKMGATKDGFFIGEQEALNTKGKDLYFKKLKCSK